MSKEEKLKNVDNRITQTKHQGKIVTQAGLLYQIRCFIHTHKITTKIHRFIKKKKKRRNPVGLNSIVCTFKIFNNTYRI